MVIGYGGSGCRRRNLLRRAHLVGYVAEEYPAADAGRAGSGSDRFLGDPAAST